MSVYEPLQSYLTDNPDASVIMSYKEIERLLGRRLPNTAYGDNKRQWWANTETHSQALAWLRANRKAKLDVKRDRVTFVRESGVSGSDASMNRGTSGIMLDGLEPATLRLLQDVAEDRGASLAGAAAILLNQMAKRRRQATLEWFAANTTPSSVTSADLVRADRDAR